MLSNSLLNDYLSITRLFGVKGPMKIPGPVTKSSVLKVTTICCLIVCASVFISTIPLLGTFENFFVNGMKYDTNIRLFVGLPGKALHFDVIEQYYGRMRKSTLSWSLTNTMVEGMFTLNEENTGLGRRKVDFYGNDGVCLFKYFVNQTDPQLPFVSVILLLNLVCFVVITISYIYINFISIKSSNQVNQGAGNKMINRRNAKMQRKISIIIATDFLCWIPFVVICCLHTLEILDATPWYALFSIIILPINSVINPLLYDDTVAQLIGMSSRRLQPVLTAISSISIRQRDRLQGVTDQVDNIEPCPGNELQVIARNTPAEEQPCSSRTIEAEM